MTNSMNVFDNKRQPTPLLQGRLDNPQFSFQNRVFPNEWRMIDTFLDSFATKSRELFVDNVENYDKHIKHNYTLNFFFCNTHPFFHYRPGKLCDRRPSILHDA